MIFPRENIEAIKIIDAAYHYADALGGNKSLSVRCSGLVQADRFMAWIDAHPEIEARRMLNDNFAASQAVRGKK